MDTPDKLVCYPANLRSGWAPPTGNAGNLPNHRSRAMNRNRKCRAVSAYGNSRPYPPPNGRRESDASTRCRLWSDRRDSAT